MLVEVFVAPTASSNERILANKKNNIVSCHTFVTGLGFLYVLLLWQTFQFEMNLKEYEVYSFDRNSMTFI